MKVLLAVPEQHSIFAQMAFQQPPSLAAPPRQNTPAATSSHNCLCSEEGHVSNGPPNLQVEDRHATMHVEHACTSSGVERNNKADGQVAEKRERPMRLADAPVEDVLNLPPPLCHAWFRHARAAAVWLSANDLAARSVATGALCSATALKELSLHVSTVLPSAREQEREGPAGHSNNTQELAAAVPTEPAKLHDASKYHRGKKATGEKRARRGRGKAVKRLPCYTSRPAQEPTAPDEGQAVSTAPVAAAARAVQPCSFVVVQQCLMAPQRLVALHMHGVHLLPHELHSFGAILRSLAPSLESLTLCQIQPVSIEHSAPTHAHTRTQPPGSGSPRPPRPSHRVMNPHSYSTDEKRLLCNAVSQLSKLVILTFPELYEFVSRGTDVIQPMACMESLETVYVSPTSVAKLCRVEPRIDFVALPQGVCCAHGHQ